MAVVRSRDRVLLQRGAICFESIITQCTPPSCERRFSMSTVVCLSDGDKQNGILRKIFGLLDREKSHQSVRHLIKGRGTRVFSREI